MRGQISGLRGPEGTNGETNEQTNDQTKVPLCSTGHRPLQSRCPKTGPVEVEIMTKMIKNDKNTSKFKKVDYFGKSTQIFFLVCTIMSYGSDIGREMASGSDWGPIKTQKWQKKKTT